MQDGKATWSRYAKNVRDAEQAPVREKTQGREGTGRDGTRRDETGQYVTRWTTAERKACLVKSSQVKSSKASKASKASAADNANNTNNKEWKRGRGKTKTKIEKKKDGWKACQRLATQTKKKYIQKSLSRANCECVFFTASVERQ